MLLESHFQHHLLGQQEQQERLIMLPQVQHSPHKLSHNQLHLLRQEEQQDLQQEQHIMSQVALPGKYMLNGVSMA
jgi:hypothetical protein